jgi:hypothetical protein
MKASFKKELKSENRHQVKAHQAVARVVLILIQVQNHL